MSPPPQAPPACHPETPGAAAGGQGGPAQGMGDERTSIQQRGVTADSTFAETLPPGPPISAHSTSRVGAGWRTWLPSHGGLREARTAQACCPLDPRPEQHSLSPERRPCSQGAVPGRSDRGCWCSHDNIHPHLGAARKERPQELTGSCAQLRDERLSQLSHKELGGGPRERGLLGPLGSWAESDLHCTPAPHRWQAAR